MEKNNIPSQKMHYLRRKQSKHAVDTEETKLSPQKVTVRDKYCQTDHHHNGRCNQESTVEPGDPPLLQQPVQTSKSGILQIIECFRSGTKQLRLMLLKEVDTIFECKLCRSLFRGLPNLITHKQFYCISKHFEHFMDEDPPNENRQSQAVKDLLDTVYPRTNQPEYVVRLEPIQTNQNAVFQTVKPISEVKIDVNITSDSTDKKEDAASIPSSALTAESETIVPSCQSDKRDTASNGPNTEHSEVSHNGDRTVKRAANSNPFSCRLCKKDFNCRRSVRRHIKKVHKKKLEDIKKFIEIQRDTPLSTKGHVNLIYTGASKSCHICHKSFATKANTRRHIDEVHKGMRRDYTIQEINTKPVKNVIAETVTPKKSLKTVSRTQKLQAKSEVNLSSCTCPFCNRRYTSQFLLKKHIKIVHKTASSVTNVKADKLHKTSSSVTNVKAEKIHKTASSVTNVKADKLHKTASSVTNVKADKLHKTALSVTSVKADKLHKTASSVTIVKTDKEQNHISTSDRKIKTEDSNTIDSSSNPVKSSPKSESKGPNHAQEKKSTSALKTKAKSEGDSPKPASSPSDDKKYKKPKLSAGFDFKQLYCKLCKRQFTSKQNLVKHIELHTDGNCIFVKFYRCPLCSYETRRKRDVIRHITVVHKKSPKALIKITANLESRAIKKPIESILDKVSKRGPQKDKVKKLGPKQDSAPSSSKKSEGADASIEVKLTKSFSLLKCKTCGKAFAKKRDLDQHKKNHKASSNNSPMQIKIKRRSTRSKLPSS